MIVGTCKLELHLPGVRSLKEKRGIIKPLMSDIRKKFGAAAAEVDFHDAWQSTTIGVAVVSTSAIHANEILEGIARWIEQNRPDLDLMEANIETLNL